ncbi:phospholipase A1 PLIP1, chloroplastic-like [Miscanthus floridulus]|uniref:phospholipase A1 PLIP1, chloroplastic-like n=1 Tax=Miscanthus floridulus TaxID=154761 RepID=UPI00345ACCB8
MVASVAAAAAAAVAAGPRHRGGSRREPATMHAGIRRSRSDPHLRCPRRGGAAGAALTTSRSIGVFPFQFGAAPLRPPPLPDGGGDGSRLLTVADADDGPPEPEPPEMPAARRPEAHWLDRLLELRSRFHDPTKRDVLDEDNDDEDLYSLDGADHHDGGCGVSYEDDGEEEAEDARWDQESFAKLLARAPLGEARLFAQLAFLCNMAYVIPEIKVEELKKHYGLRLVTSSLEKKAEAGIISAKLDADSTRPRTAPAYEVASGPQPRRPIRSSHLAYEVAASAASYVHARARGLLSFGATPPQQHQQAGQQGRLYNSGVAAYMAASTVTAVVAAEDEARQEAARDLRSPLSSPCEWFVCDEADARTRCLVIQGSDSVASWQANLLFEPTEFEGTGVLVHRGIYEAAKGIYEQVMPEIEAHLRAHAGARLRLTGHSLGGSLAVLVSLMLLARGMVTPDALHPVVTFGAPSVFCGGNRVLEALGVGEAHVRSVAMHRDIVPRAFSCRYPGHAIALLKRLNGVLRTHPCLNTHKALYTPMGATYILQPDSGVSPRHPFLPEGAALFRLDSDDAAPRALVASALRAFLNSPHPLETLSDLSAYGAGGAILRDHESSNYFRALSALARAPPRRRKQPEIVWQLPGVERLQQYWWPGIAGTVIPAPVAVSNKELVSEA